MFPCGKHATNKSAKIHQFELCLIPPILTGSKKIPPRLDGILLASGSLVKAVDGQVKTGHSG